MRHPRLARCRSAGLCAIHGLHAAGRRGYAQKWHFCRKRYNFVIFHEGIYEKHTGLRKLVCFSLFSAQKDTILCANQPYNFKKIHPPPQETLALSNTSYKISCINRFKLLLTEQVTIHRAACCQLSRLQPAS